MFRRRVVAGVITVLAAIGLVGVVSPSAEAATAPCRQYVYAYGGSATCVKAIQTLLNTAYNYDTHDTYISGKLVRDGYFGSKTHRAVLQFQRGKGLVTDGRVGPKTWASLCNSAHYWGPSEKLKKQHRWADKYAC